MSRDPVAHWVAEPVDIAEPVDDIVEPVDDIAEPAPLARAVACISPPRLGQRSRARELGAALAATVPRAGLVIAITVTLASLMAGPRVMKVFAESKADIANATVRKYAYEAYPSWRAQHPTLVCPNSLDELNEYMTNKDVIDPWGSPYLAACDATGHLRVWSAGEDQRFETVDDIRSDE